MQKLYFVRHGQSTDNAADIWSRRESPLTEEGRAQARAAAEDAQYRQLTFDIIISSPQPRALETAQIIAQGIGYPVERIEQAEILVERDFGSLTTQPHNDFWAHHSHYREMDNIEGVEKLADLQMRANAALELLKKRPEARILVVGHGSFARALRRAVKGQSYEVEYVTSVPEGRLPNGEIIEFI